MSVCGPCLAVRASPRRHVCVRWYHGAITRVEAEKTLRSEREGSYLVRICESSRQDYSLSLK